ncbi:MAG: Rieske (2Fe-2S) protein [Flavobacteriales bacterium]|nr:Rieske (2Fe-2S) protein [Flavobacteriales bacterium]MCB9167517.1 Rieske (2Fe-2S) protein [Flavobacteriales bacterium]
MERRDFLLTGCRACVALAAIPALAALESCGSAKAITAEPAPGSNLLNIPLSDLAEQNAVRVNTKELGSDLLVVKEADGSYKALLLKCTHKGGPLKQEGQVLHCSWHGSEFDLEGKVTNGPATSPLKTFPATVVDGQVQVNLG